MRYLFVFLTLVYLNAQGQHALEKFRQLENMMNTSSLRSLQAFGLRADSIAAFLVSNKDVMFPGDFTYHSVSKKLKAYKADSTNQIFPVLKDELFFPAKLVEHFEISPNAFIVAQHELDDSLYRAYLGVTYSYQPVLLNNNDSLYRTLDALMNTGLYEDDDTSSGKMKFIRKLQYNRAGQHSFTNNRSDTAFKTYLRFSPELAQIPDIQELVVEGSVRTLKNKIPLDAPFENVVPICVKTSNGIYAFKKVANVSYEKGRWTIVSHFERTYGGTPFLKVEADWEQTQHILADIMVLIKNIVSSPPISAHIAIEERDEIICTRNRQKTDLLNGKYETATYRFRVKENEFLNEVREEYKGIELSIFIQVFAANHPDNPFEEVTPREMAKYDNAVKELKNQIKNILCERYECTGNNPPVIR